MFPSHSFVVCLFIANDMQYNRSKSAFESVAQDKDYITKQQWLDDGPQSDDSQVWIANIWRVFSNDGQKMTVCFLLFSFFLFNHFLIVGRMARL